MSNKNKKILTMSTIILTAIISSIAVIVTAVKINGKIFSKDGGDYYEEFGLGEMSTKDFYSLNYSDYKDTYFGANTRNDYKDYVENSRDGYCLNENVGTGSFNFYVANIIDIQGNKITFQKSGKTYEASTEREKKAVANMAYAVYARYNKIGNNSYWRRWMDNLGGWRYFYNTFKKDIDDEGLRGNIGNTEIDTANKDYESFIKSLKPIEDNNTTDPIAQVGEWKVDNKTYKTKIGPYSLSLNNNSNITTTVTCVAGSTYNGIVHKESGKYYLYLTDEIKVKPTKITIKQSYTAYEARLVLLATGIDQARLIGRGREKTVSIDLDIKTMPKFETNVSLQKYITKINGEDLTNNSTTLTNRKNTYSRSDERNKNAKKIVSKSEQNNMQESTYKRDNVVNIEAGDIVTYRIHVYNNSDVNADKIVVRDQLLYYDSNQYGEYQLESIIRDGNKDVKGDWKLASGTSTHEYEYTINNLGANSETYFDISVKVNTYITNVIANTAYIKDTTPTNKNEYRTKDRDYIKMKPYKVSLQKIVYSVNGMNTDQNTRWKSWESTANVNNNPSNETYNRNNLYSKHNNPVTVANGDTVRYAIKVRNDGDTQANITKISDNLPSGVSLQGVYNQDGSKCSYTQNGNNIEITGESGLFL